MPIPAHAPSPSPVRVGSRTLCKDCATGEGWLEVGERARARAARALVRGAACSDKTKPI